MGKSNIINKLLISLFCLSLVSTNADSIPPEVKGSKGFKDILKEGDARFIKPYGSWIFENDQLILPVKNELNERVNIWLKDDYEDFIIELDFKLDSGTNSGLFFRTTNIKDEVQTGIEIQIRDDYGKSPIDQHFCGGVYETKQPSVNMVKKPLEWNHLKVTVKGNSIVVILNGVKVNDIDLSQWTEAGKNPDGTVNKFKTAYCNMSHRGKIGFQDHGGKVWFKNIRIKSLKS